MKLPSLAECRKAVVAVVGLAGEVAATSLLHGTAEQIVQRIVAAAIALGVYSVPNARPNRAEDPANVAAVNAALLGQ